jgi:hypothetical protein
MMKSDLRFIPSPRQCTRAPKKTDDGHAKYPPLTELVTNVRLMGENVITANQTHKLTLDSASLKNSDAYTIPTPASFTTGIHVVGDEMKRTDDSFEGGTGCTAKVCATLGFCGEFCACVYLICLVYGEASPGTENRGRRKGNGNTLHVTSFSTSSTDYWLPPRTALCSLRVLSLTYFHDTPFPHLPQFVLYTYVFRSTTPPHTPARVFIATRTPQAVTRIM